MNNILKENGFLSDQGKLLTHPFKVELLLLLTTEEVDRMSVAELQTLKFNLMKMIADECSEAIRIKEKELRQSQSEEV